MQKPYNGLIDKEEIFSTHPLTMVFIATIFELPATLKETVKRLIAFFILNLFYGCFSYDRKPEVFKTDKDFVEFGRIQSPDNSMLLLSYGIDQGAFGTGNAGTAVLKLSDTSKNLRLFTLSNSFDRLNWLDNKTVSAKYDTIPFVRSGEPSNFKDLEVNGVKVKVSSYDYIEPNSKQIIEHGGLHQTGSKS